MIEAPMHITVSAHELVEALNFNDESIFRFICEMLEDERVGSDVAERLRNQLNEQKETVGT